MLLEHLPNELHEVIKSFDTAKLRKTMDLMKIRIHFFKDMKNHTYFFRSPVYDSAVAERFLVKLKQPDEVKLKILGDLASLLEDLPSSFESKAVSERCNKYLKEQNLKNEDVFSLLRFAITGNPVGAPVGDICEIIGKDPSIERLT